MVLFALEDVRHVMCCLSQIKVEVKVVVRSPEEKTTEMCIEVVV